MDIHAPHTSPPRASSRAATWIVIAAGIASLAVVGYAITRPSEPRVVLVGDSITVFAAHDLKTTLASGHRPEIHAVMGKRIDQMLPALQVAMREHPHAVVLNLGTNDMFQASTRPDWQRGFNRMIALAAPAPCVVLVTINTLLQPAAVGEAINQAIVGAAATHNNFRVLDWNALVHGPNGGALTVDRVHPSESGAQQLALRTRDIVDHHC